MPWLKNKAGLKTGSYVHTKGRLKAAPTHER